MRLFEMNMDKRCQTKGNVVDPLTEIDKIGVDAFRFTFALAAQEGDILWNDKRAEGLCEVSK